MESVYHIVTIRVNETSWAHVCRLRFCYLRMGYDRVDDLPIMVSYPVTTLMLFVHLHIVW
jgi:hypothetical protein